MLHLRRQLAGACADGQVVNTLTIRGRDQVMLKVTVAEIDRDIAKQLHIATTTVYSHLDRIRDKTGKRRRAQLVRLYVQDHEGKP